MSSSAIMTVVKMMESLPTDIQDRIVEHLQEYVDELQDELHWNQSFRSTEDSLIAMARRAKQEIAERKATLMDK